MRGMALQLTSGPSASHSWRWRMATHLSPASTLSRSGVVAGTMHAFFVQDTAACTQDGVRSAVLMRMQHGMAHESSCTL
jgi:hypothetical protein